MLERNEVVEQHYRNHYDRLVAQSIGRVGSVNAEDAVQEAYTRALKYWGSFDYQQGTFDEWFYQIWLNACSDTNVFVNKGMVVRADTEVQSDHPAPAAPSAVELGRIASLLREEPDPRRRILELRLVKGFTETEIREILPVTKTQITTVVNRFRKKL